MTDIRLRPFRPADAVAVGALISRTYSHYNLGFATPEERTALLGPFAYAASADPEHRAAIATALRAPTVLVATERDVIVGVLRGGRLDRPGRTVLQSLFVAGSHQGGGIGRSLVEAFEQSCRDDEIGEIKVASTIEAVGFYTRLGYRRTTGVRHLRGIDGGRLPYQPMLKRLGLAASRSET